MYLIKLRGNEVFLAGFDRDTDTVTVTRNSARARGFRTEHAAVEFIDLYADAGYGLDSADALVVPTPRWAEA